jgi:alkylated DNA repair dioxygenase AlkB
VQPSLFDSPAESWHPVITPKEDGDVRLYPALIDAHDTQALFDALKHEIAWEQREIQVYGKRYLQPRLLAWYGDVGIRYRYSGDTLIAKPWTQTLERLKAVCETVTQSHFNSVLLNLYRDGQDAMGWHADNEPELGTEPVIASVSLGCPRRFDLKHRSSGLRRDVFLPDGSLLVMAGRTQQHWVHQIARSAKIQTPRINLTFRWITG